MATHQKFSVYELDRGWGFDGRYIPHLLELNWYFAEDPFTYKSTQNIRIHGLTKGRASLNVAVAGMQTEYDSDYGKPQIVDLPYHPAITSSEFVPATNYAESANRGISLQLKFEGRWPTTELGVVNIMQPEPPHVLQVLAMQNSPQGNGKRAN